jgi:hypothetical protein
MDAQLIKQTVTVPDVLARYGVEVKHGRCRGFCHDGRDLNMAVSERSCHCFVCNRQFDIFSIVMHFEQCTFADALRRLDTSNSYADTLRAKRAARAARERTERERVAALHSMDTACEYLRLYRQRVLYAPQSPDEELHPLFAESLQKLSAAEINYDLEVRGWTTAK